MDLSAVVKPRFLTDKDTTQMTAEPEEFLWVLIKALVQATERANPGGIY